MSDKPLEYHPGAISDVKSAVAWYRERSPKAALDFIEELHRAAETIRQAPERWPLGKSDTRRFLLWRFPFSIIYSEQEIRNHNLGGRSRQQATGVLGSSSETCVMKPCGIEDGAVTACAPR